MTITPEDKEAAKDAALELFIAEKIAVADEWGINAHNGISRLTLEGIDAEANERIRIKFLAAYEQIEALKRTVREMAEERDAIEAGIALLGESNDLD